MNNSMDDAPRIIDIADERQVSRESREK